MTIKLYNTKVRKKVDFAPIDVKNVRMYVCGPTVYDRAHLGNARPVIVFDTLFRLLRHTYGADHVTYVRNFTDVDDKINATALARKEAGAVGTLEDLVRERSDETIEWYLKDMGALGALEPTRMPRATEFIGPMVAMIADLIEKGHAYEAEGHVLFAVESYAEYGALSGRTVEDMIAGSRVEVAPYKRNPMDFVLWKPSSDDLPGWDSPWGRGRPGWHIECSAMSYELLGASFDIHGGGNDLQFPHHENEIAQSACAHPEGDFANVWMHNEMLQVEGKKMSKSLGNFFTVRDLLECSLIDGEIRKEEWFDLPNSKRIIRLNGELIRCAMMLVHYRSAMDFSSKLIEEAHRLHGVILRSIRSIEQHDEGLPLPDEFVAYLRNDLDTRGALKWLEKVAVDRSSNWVGHLSNCYHFLGLMRPRGVAITSIKRSISTLDRSLQRYRAQGGSIEKLNHELDESGYLLRMAGINQEFGIAGNELDIGKFDGTVDEFVSLKGRFDPSAIEQLIQQRADAKASKDWAKADAIRGKLDEMGVLVKDEVTGTTWKIYHG